MKRKKIRTVDNLLKNPVYKAYFKSRAKAIAAFILAPDPFYEWLKKDHK